MMALRIDSNMADENRYSSSNGRNVSVRQLMVGTCAGFMNRLQEIVECFKRRNSPSISLSAIFPSRFVIDVADSAEICKRDAIGLASC